MTITPNPITADDAAPPRTRRIPHRIGMMLAAACLATGSVHAADGDPDPTFSADGITTVTFSGGGVDDVRIAADARGNTFVGGTIRRSDDNIDYAIAKLRPDGTPDPGFGFQGLRTIGVDAVPLGHDKLHGIVPQADGKVLLLGYAEVADEIVAASPPAIVRLTAAGNADPTFGEEGRIVVDGSPWPNGRLYLSAAIAQRDGKLLFGGYCLNCPGTYRVFVLRMTAAGAVDTTFGSGGWTSIPVTGQPRIEAMKLDHQGRIVLAGVDSGSSPRPVVVRVLPNGNADTSFGTGGVVTLLDLPSANEGGWAARAVAPDTDGSLVLAVGNWEAGSPNRGALVRLGANGVRDMTYAGTGLRNLTREEGTRLLALERRSDGRVIAAGWIDPNGTNGQDFFFARVMRDGALDTSFDANGVVRVQVTAPGQDGVEAMMLVAGKPVAAGYAYTPGRNIGVVRMQSDLVFADGLE